ncbi:MAG: carbohydrate kinase family protein [Angustibacter sp.]
MRIAITGSIATDHLMTFPGRFAESILPDRLAELSVSFLVSDLDVRRGGVAANIAFGLGQLGRDPLLIGAVGADFAEYRSWLERHGVDCTGVHLSELQHTARFTCTTDADQAQISSFYPGAMSEARNIELAPLAGSGFDLVLIGPNDPEAMTRHSDECRERRYPFAADPSQQLSFAEGPYILRLITGAEYLFGNDYEDALIREKTGHTAEQLLELVGTRITTLGGKGVRIERRGETAQEVPAIADIRVANPTGAGDAFRAGFLAGLSWNVSLANSARLGCAVASFAVETVGTQEYDLASAGLWERLVAGYGEREVAELRAPLRAVGC